MRHVRHSEPYANTHYDMLWALVWAAVVTLFIGGFTLAHLDPTEAALVKPAWLEIAGARA